MRILVTGAGGQVGRELARQSGADHHVTALRRDQLDILDPAAIEAALRQSRAGLLVNAAAYTAVDQAEQDEAAAFAVNADGPGLLSAAAASAGIPLIHISTDYVFDGTGSGAYREDDAIRPLGVYGRSKAAGEQAVRAGGGSHVILRTAWVYAAHGSNFVRTMLRAGAVNRELRVVSDQTGAPTAAGDIAGSVLALAGAIAGGRTDIFGTLHYTARGQTSWHGFAEAIFDLAGARIPARPAVRPIPTSAWPTPAQRPANSVLDCGRIDRLLGPPRRHWRDGLAAVLDELLGPASTGRLAAGRA